MRTILQKIGPLYGEDVNGTVFGQPNGSEYIPPINSVTIVEENSEVTHCIKTSENMIYCCKSNGVINTKYRLLIQGQIPWDMFVEFSDTEDFTNIISSGAATTREPLVGVAWLGGLADTSTTLVKGQTYYGRVSIRSRLSGAVMVTLPIFSLLGWTP